MLALPLAISSSDCRRAAARWLALVLAIPAAVAYRIHAQMTSTPSAPNFARTVHPAPPDLITVHETEYALGTVDNPYRTLETSDPDLFAEHVAEAKRALDYLEELGELDGAP